MLTRHTGFDSWPILKLNCFNFVVLARQCAAAGFDPHTCKDWKQTPTQFQFDQAWINLPTMHLGQTPGTVVVDLSSLGGEVPTAVRHAWGETDCCDLSDPDLYVTHGCIANCPIMSSSALPANPFMAKIVGGKCKCMPPGPG